jgi:hypothetical protein
MVLEALTLLDDIGGTQATAFQGSSQGKNHPRYFDRKRKRQLFEFGEEMMMISRREGYVKTPQPCPPSLKTFVKEVDTELSPQPGELDAGRAADG